MKYRVTCLTPTLVGDGARLSPVDYMVWKDQVNILDQRRIFRMLAKGPRLNTYLAQIQRATRLNFAEWGGYAQNYAGRRVPLEHPSIAATLDRARPDMLHIPTFASTWQGPYLPATAVRGALRTAMVWKRWRERGVEKVIDAAAARIGERVPRRLAQAADSMDPTLEFGDGSPLKLDLKVYYLRTARLQSGLTWKETSPSFVEMASPGTAFEGRLRETGDVAKAVSAANEWSAALLELHLAYAKQAQLPALAASIEGLRFKAASAAGESCLLAIGWGGGFLNKTAAPDTSGEAYRKILRAMPFYSRAIQTGLAFPKTRRVVHLNQQPAALPGWILLEVRR
jgi:CRISPR-associated protein Csm5